MPAAANLTFTFLQADQQVAGKGKVAKIFNLSKTSGSLELGGEECPELYRIGPGEAQVMCGSLILSVALPREEKRSKIFSKFPCVNLYFVPPLFCTVHNSRKTLFCSH